ncbi:tRNA (N(6)-L-threonylcarbamoyladenosine(37)-C(2))-methylthiotransferase [Ferroplasma acidiphilum]|jgi:MiaB-like tRNA modifying enzyme|uniref:tRNA (N(6)-L-threonylcarbamoyladenosine(37)-C(2))- methylthiotransferase n=1 Tax=Ferroplasma acidiphilum TaxID=74969 RepID=UPI0023EF8D91|nr:tRNA (N(6)-L-threonylcarbamoyladenosine(37)-C(2))-methylthiotransferase [Ferroplasma acidiphilum]MCL4349319.1 tRNA (N(6)-L-threonylcarbamoyladenosine(37)-C(2))-methylthiotransferase [Candidatus Thermoplasmatota archaeon]
MKIYFESYGCTLQKSESSLYLNKLLKDENNQIVNSPEEADLSLIGTCVVIKHTEDRMVKRISSLSKVSGNVQVLGCLATVNGNTIESGNVQVLKPREFRSFYEGDLDGIEIKSDIYDGIPINQGCTGSCNFCISHIARGKLLSRGIDKIVNQINMELDRNIKEIRISSLDTAAYGKDIGTDLAELVNRISSIGRDFYLRVGMLEPRNTYDILDKLVDAYRHDNVFKFLHLPVQSAENNVLSAMNREYTIEEAEAVWQKFHDAFPDMSIATDIILGYYNDSRAGFEKTMKFLEKYNPDIINVTRFSPRPYTKDYNKTPLNSNLLKEWSNEIISLHREQMEKKLDSYLGREEKVLITEKGKNGTMVGRDINYRPVVLKGNYEKYSEIKCTIVSHGSNYLIGE